MQSLSSRIWTRIVVSNSYDDNHYTTGTSWEDGLLNGKKKFFLSFLQMSWLNGCGLFLSTVRTNTHDCLSQRPQQHVVSSACSSIGRIYPLNTDTHSRPSNSELAKSHFMIFLKHLDREARPYLPVQENVFHKTVVNPENKNWV